MADLIIKPASGSDSLIFQDGAGTAVATISTNHVHYSKGVSETKGTSTNATNAMSVDLATGNFFEIDLQNNNATVSSMTFSNPAASGKASAWTIKWIQGSTARALQYPNSVYWGGGIDHVMSTADNAVDIVSFFTIDGGTSIYATVVGTAFAN